MVKTKAEIDLRNCEIAFRNAGLHSAYITLKLNTILKDFLTVDTLSEILVLKKEPLKRFLNAMVFLDVCKRNNAGEYKHHKDLFFTDQPTKVLMWLVDNDIPYKLFKQPQTINELEKQYKLKELGAFLQNAIELGLLYQNSLKQYCVYNEIVPYLSPDNPSYMGPKLLHYREIMFKTFCANTIINALKENRSQWKLIIGKDISTPFEAYQDNPELMSIFTKAMHQLNEHDNHHLLSMIDLSKATNVLDLGGGSGALALSLIKLFPSLTVDIYEHYNAIGLMRNIFVQYATHEQQKEIKHISGDFLSSPNSMQLEGLEYHTKYSAIFLSWILHDWADSQCQIILKKVRRHLENNGRIIIVEELVEDEIGYAAISDITMLLHTQGRERSFKEYKDLLLSSGFCEKSISVVRQEHSRRQLIIAKQEET